MGKGLARLCCGWADEKGWLHCAQAGRLLDSQSRLILSLACQTQLLNCICYGGGLLDLGSCVSRLSCCPSACSCSPAATLWASDQEFCSEEPSQWGRVSVCAAAHPGTEEINDCLQVLLSLFLSILSLMFVKEILRNGG